MTSANHLQIVTERASVVYATASRLSCPSTSATPPRPPIPNPVPSPVSMIQGSQFLIWKQDPTVTALGIRPTFVPSLVLDGPRDARITTELAGTTPVNANANRDFVFAPGTAEFDCAHSFAVVRETLTMYQRLWKRGPLPWAWNTAGNTQPLTVFPRAGVTANAFYSRNQKALKFFHFTPSNSAEQVFTCRSFDIVAHECGHAILDGLKPGWLTSTNPQAGGLHEAIGDLTALFLACSQLDQVEAAIALTKANLHKRNFLAALAEQFGSALGMPQGLRNADNDLKLSQVGNEVHAISQVFTGAVYDILADIFEFEKRRQAETKDPARVLLEVASDLCALLLEAISKSPDVNPAYADVVNQMLQASMPKHPAIYRTFIRKHFVLREVVVSATPLAALMAAPANFEDPQFADGGDIDRVEGCAHISDGAQQDRSTCCGTMQLPEHRPNRTSLAPRRPISDDDLLADDVAVLESNFK